MKNRFTSFILILTLVLLFLPTKTFAKDTVNITVSDATAKAGETVEMIISVENNPGISGASLTVVYDKFAMTLTEIRPIAAGNFLADLDHDNFSWLKGRNISGDFDLVVLCFSINVSSGGNYSVSAKLTGNLTSNITNQDASPVKASFVSGTLSVVNSKDHVCDGSGKCPSKTFDDVSANKWYHEYIDYVVQNGLMIGTSQDSFSPELICTRAMVITTLYRVEGMPNVDTDNPFVDVKSDMWYTDAIIWAYKNNIIRGYSAELFGPNDNITREQIATILYRYAKYKALGTSHSSDLSEFDDTNMISTWALESIKWANGIGLIRGRTETTLVPEGLLNRAELATLLYRWCDDINSTN